MNEENQIIIPYSLLYPICIDIPVNRETVETTLGISLYLLVERRLVTRLKLYNFDVLWFLYTNGKKNNHLYLIRANRKRKNYIKSKVFYLV